MAEIIIPKRLSVRLSHEDAWQSCVTQLKKNIEPLLAKDPDFFPDYTIHGIDHINRCLDIADHLIDFDTLSKEPKTTDLLTPRDVAFLICGIMLHDMGMFLRPDGVRKLVQMARTNDAFGGASWKKEWSGYVDHTKRLSEEKMRYHFGKVTPVTEDCVNHIDTDDNKRIIGEFLRQHHARLAHELALGVLPGSIDTDLFKNTSLKEKDRKLIGLLARSHGMDIRDTEDYVNKHIGKGPKPYNTPIFYLMTVLRTADALDANERRAPEALERQQKINVPISVEEWTWNQCIDPEACDWRMDHKNRYIEADPHSSLQYVQLDKWLKGVQADLDLCLSILEEKYPYDQYRLSIHRVVSNIHETGIKETLNETFLTKEVKITTTIENLKPIADSLYRDDPTYGIRELLQNALDACVERKYWEQTHGNPNYKGLVDIRIEGNTFTITDNGMGMNEHILLNYLLTNASYRSSDAWLANYAANGKSQVARTGRFGVGFLASFVLGDKVEVSTQHRESEKGYHFTFALDSKPLDIKREKRVNPYAAETDDSTHAGTTITIELKDNALKKLSSSDPKYPWYNWYAFDEPKVRYFFNGEEQHHKKLQLHRDPNDNDGWLTLPSDIFDTYQWKPIMDHAESEFYCNGIRIYSGLPDNLDQFGLDVHPPHVSVVDSEGKLDVFASRQELKSVPEEQALYRSVFLWHMARLLLTPWDTEEDYRKNLTLGFPLLHRNPKSRIPFLLSPNGFSLNYAPLLPALTVNEYVILYYEGADPRDSLKCAWSFLKKDVPCFILAADSSEQKSSGMHSERENDYGNSGHFVTGMPNDHTGLLDLESVEHNVNYCTSNVYNQKPSAEGFEKKYYYSDPGSYLTDLFDGHSGLLDLDNIKYKVNVYASAVWLRSDARTSIPKSIQDNLRAASFTGDLMTAFYYDHTSNMPILLDQFQPNQFPVAVHMVLDLHAEIFRDHANTLFVQTLKDTLRPEPGYPQDLWIPYNMEERKRKFHTVFKELEAYQTQFHNEQKRKDRQKAEEAAMEARRKAEEAAMEARRKAEEAAMEARFNTFKSNHAQVITQLLQLMPHSAPQSLPHILSETMSKIIAADFLGRPWNSLPEESLSELKAMCLAQFKLDDGELTAEDLHAEREEIEDFLFKQYEEMVSADNRGALTRLQSTLPPI